MVDSPAGVTAAARGKTSPKEMLPNDLKINKIARRNPKSPIRLTMNAFLAASLVGGVPSRLEGPVVPETDQQIGAEPHAFPPEKHQEEIIREDQVEHHENEEVQVREKPPEARVAVHVSDRIKMDQESDAGDNQAEDDRELVDPVRRGDGQVPRRDPLKQGDRKRAGLRGRTEHPGEDGSRKEEREPDRAAPDEPAQALGIDFLSEDAVEQKTGERNKDDIADEVHHFMMLISSIFTVCLLRKSAMTIASPTAASAAATAITKKTNTWPRGSPRKLENATSVRFTELSINSMLMNTMIAFRRMRTPSIPIVNRMALRTR